MQTNTWFRTLRVAGVLLTSWCVSWASAEQDGAGELLNILRQKDSQLSEVPGGVRVSFRMVSWAHPFDVGHGKNVANCTMSWTPDTCAIKVTSNYDRPPVYRPRRSGSEQSLGYQPVDYDAEGNLIVWRWLEKHILFTKDQNDTLKVAQMVRVDPQGSVLERKKYTELFRYPVGRWGTIPEFTDFRMATGQGFAERLEKVTRVESLESGLEKLTADGVLVPGLRGRWILVVDPGASHLVREATFAFEDMSEPSIFVRSSGSITSGGLTIARHGVVRHGSSPGDWEVSFDVIGIAQRPTPDPLLEEVKARLAAPLPPGKSETVDSRGDRTVRLRTPARSNGE